MINLRKIKAFSKGQNLAEVALVVALVGLVFAGMQIYLKRGVQGKLKDLTDTMVSNGSPAQAANPDSTKAHESSRNNIVSVSSTTFEESKDGVRSLSGIEETKTETSSYSLTEE
ncbi:MAG: hypothetical protein WC543_00945 [Candidatus Omnitrophota bacterium]